MNAEQRIADHVRRALAEAPPLSREQRDKLYVLLAPARQRRAQAAREATRQQSSRGTA